jgi:tetratricopeptide (TPR) repeat protein
MSVDDEATTHAIRRHEERLARDPHSLAFAQLADLYRKVGRTGEAIALCRTGLGRYPQYVTARLILAKTLVAEGQVDDALAELDAILETSPHDVQSQRLAAELRRRKGDLDGAVRHLQAVVRLDPVDRDSRALLAMLGGDASGGEANGLARFLRDDAFATPSFGAVCLDQGLTEEAALVFTRILRANPTHARAREGLEQALRARSRRKG